MNKIWGLGNIDYSTLFNKVNENPLDPLEAGKFIFKIFVSAWFQILYFFKKNSIISKSNRIRQNYTKKNTNFTFKQFKNNI